MAQRQGRSGNQEIMRADHHSARFQVSPNPGMESRLSQFKRLDENRRKYPLNMLLASCFSSSVNGSLDAVQEFRSSDSSDQQAGCREIAGESRSNQICAVHLR